MFLRFIFEIFFNLPTPAAARSLAIPLTPKQSGRLGVMDKSITFSVLFLKKFLPTLSEYSFDFSYVIPSLSSDKFNSDSEHNIPYEVTPLILLTVSFMLFFGITDPGPA